MHRKEWKRGSAFDVPPLIAFDALRFSGRSPPPPVYALSGDACSPCKQLASISNPTPRRKCRVPSLVVQLSMEYYDDDPTMMEEEEEEEEEEEGYRSQTLSDSEDETPVDKKNKAEHFRRVLLPAIQSRVTALGGLEDVVYRRPRADYQRPEDASSDFDEVEDEDKYEEFTIKMYKLGDEALGCLKDLKKFWKMDDSDDERSISKLFFETGVLKNDLLNILNLAGLPGSSIRHEKAALAAGETGTEHSTHPHSAHPSKASKY